MRHILWIAICLAALALGLSAGAATSGHPHGHPSGIVPPSPGRAAALSRAQAFGSGNLLYGGGPVMRAITNYAIYWVPPGYSFNSNNANYENTIDQYFRDVAADSGTGSNVYSIDTQYYDTIGGGTHHVAYSSSFGGSFVDTDPFPSTHGCADRNDSTCINDGYVQQEIHAIALANNWPLDGSSQYFLFTPKNVGECTDTSSTECAYSTFCAYHSYSQYGGVNQMIYAYQPWTAHWAGGACDVGEYPNNSDADPTINVMSHENNEAITDPDTETGWIDAAGYEDGDKCAWIFGSVSGNAGSFYNQTINGHHYFMQEEYSNAQHNCFQAMPAVPANNASPAISGTAAVGQTLTATAGTWSNSPTTYTYSWEHCDSSGNNCATTSTAPATSATTNTYTVKPADDTFTIRVSVVAKNNIGSGSPAQSAATSIVNGEPVYVSGVSLTGVATVGQTLTAHAGSWSPAATKYVYAWQRCDSGGANCSTFKTISATSAATATYKLAAADDRKAVRVSVTAQNNAGTSLAQQSSATSVVAGEPVSTVSPTIAGTATVGQKLTAVVGSWSPPATKYSYTWQRCDSSGHGCAQITGAANATYKLGAADRSHTIRVTVTALNAAGSSDPRQSAPTSLVA